jgi:class 3 adenylate cyclase
MLETPAQPRTTLTPVALPEAAFLITDIVGFTAFTERHGDAPAAELAWRLRLGVEQQLGHDAHVIKTLGDAVMVRIADPAEAVAAGLRIVSHALPAAADPPLRVGIHCGPAVECAGDFFGAAVNLAARVASLAGPGEVLVTEPVASAARRRGLVLDELGQRSLRNVARPVLVHAARAASPPAADRDAARAERATRRRPLCAHTLTPTLSPVHAQL